MRHRVITRGHHEAQASEDGLKDFEVPREDFEERYVGATYTARLFVVGPLPHYTIMYIIPLLYHYTIIPYVKVV